MSDVNNNQNYEVKQSAYGLGLFATQDITRGELIKSEKPIIKLRQNVPAFQLEFYVETETSKLNEQDKKLMFELSDNNEPKTAVGIFKTNGFMLGKKAEYCGIFYILSRMNHSCKPNVCYHWCENEGVQKVFALKEIKQGEEILTSYIDLYQDREDRMRQLKKSFNFDCCCELCSIEDDDQVEESDERRRELNELENFRPKMGLREPNLFLTNKKKMLKLLKEEGMEYDAYYVNKIAYDVFSFLFKTNASKESLKLWANMAYENALVCQGKVNGSLKNEILNFCNKM